MKLIVLLIGSAAFFLPLAKVKAERFVANVSLTLSYSAGGVVASTRQTKPSLLALCGSEAGLDPRTLELVYDTTADALQVVKKSDGSFVCTQISFSGGTTIANTARTKLKRQAFITLEGQAEPTGSVFGSIVRAVDATGHETKFTWVAQFQFTQPANLLIPDSVGKGTLTTGRKFVPTTH